jgi:hypothetical protein
LGFACLYPLTIIHYLNLVDLSVFPNKADSPPVVDSDTMLSQAISLECFQAISRRHPQIVEGYGPMEQA